MISSVIGSPRVRVDLATQPYRGFADDHREAARPLQRNGKRAVGRLRYPGVTPPLGTRPISWTRSNAASLPSAGTNTERAPGKHRRLVEQVQLSALANPPRRCERRARPSRPE